MLEIDDVRSAIESGANFELGDNLSDEYYCVIDLATRPAISEGEKRALHRRLDFLIEHGDYIGRVLAKHDDEYDLIFTNTPDTMTVSAAYMSTLEQVKRLANYDTELV